MDKIEKPPVFNVSEHFNAFVNASKYSGLLYSINEKYLYWDKVKHQQLPDNNLSKEKLWGLVKVGRHFMLAQYPYVNVGKHIFKYCLPYSLQKQLHYFDLNIGGSLGSKSLIPDADKNSYLVSSIMEEAIASSQIEGAVTTRQQAKEMLKKGRAPRNKSEQMIANNYETIQYIVSIQHEPLTLERLKEVHRLVSHNTLNDPLDEGNFRTSNDVDVIDAVDGEIVYTPPIHTEVEGMLNELCTFFNKNEEDKFIHPIVKGIIVHFMIGYIHPFADGNGRTARALFYWYLLSQNYWLTEYLSISRMIVKSKEQYAKAYLYTENDDNDLTYFIQYNIKVMRLAYEELRLYIQRKIEEKKRFNYFQQIPGINERQSTILKWLVDEPNMLLTVKEIEIRLKVNNQTARNDLNGLIESGYLTVVNDNKKPRLYQQTKKFDTLVKRK